MYAGATLVMTSSGLVAQAFMPNPFLQGLLLGIVLAAVPGFLWSWILQTTGTAPQMMGDQAEQWTASELRKLAANGWCVVNHFMLGKGDMDHVLIGPGGAVVVETKWSSAWRDDYERSRQRAATQQARQNARQMTWWAPIRELGVPVRPVVVLWGPDVRDWPDGERVRHVDDVPVVTGPALGEWVLSLPTDQLAQHHVRAVWNLCDKQVRVRDPLDEHVRDMPASTWDMVAGGIVMLVTACLALLLIATSLTWTEPAWWSLGLVLLTVPLALRTMRWRRARPAAWGWIAAVGVLVLLSLGVATGLMPVT